MPDTYYYKKPTETVDQYNARMTGATSGVNLASYKTPTPPTQPTIGDAYSGASYDSALSSQADYYKSIASTPVDEQTIRDTTMKRFQAEIDATAKIYADKLARAKVQGANREGQTTAINARRGLIGSDFGAANTANTQQDNETIYSGIEAEKMAAISALYNKAENAAKADLEAKTKARNEGADKYISYLKESATRATTKATDAAKAALAAGVDLSSDKATLSELAKRYGISSDALLSSFTTAKQEQDKLKAEQAAASADLEYKKAQTASIAEKDRYQSIGDGSMLYDTKTGQVVANNPKTFAPSSGGSFGATGNPGQSARYATDLDALTGSVLATIPTKFGQQQFQAQMSKTRNDGDKINLMASLVLKQAPAEVKRDFANQAVGITEIDKAIKILDQGAKTGVLNSTAQYTFNVLGKDFDPNLTAINAHLTAAIQPYRNSVTGAAWGTQEEQEYASLFGSTKYSPQELRQRLVQAKEVLKAKSAAGLNVYVNPMGYYDNQFATGTYQPTTQASPLPTAKPQGTTKSGNTFRVISQ